MSEQSATQNELAARLLSSYRPFPGVSDELLDPDGNVRPVWRQFVDHFGKLSPDDVTTHFARGDQYLRDEGVFYRQYDEDGSSEREWPLSHVPVLMDEADWRHVTDGLTQRADLLESIVADLYGENRLVAEGHLPASIIAMSKEWLRPLVGVKPASGHYLHFLAFEIGRGPDGSWWVLGDRTQAPSGAGFALENRVATTRIFADLYPAARVHRLAGFFKRFRDTLNDLRRERDNRVAVLTPGPFNDTYFEHAYIARYLGFSLLEGEDLTVEGGQLMVRTVSGLQPISVLWRRLDSSYVDPLELEETSRIGTPGLLSAIRQGNVSMVNAIGAGVLETRALLAFMPRLSRALLGEPLKLANIATWWCGQPTEREHVQAHIDEMVIGPALSTRLPFENDDATAFGKQLRSVARDALDHLLHTQGPQLVGQEAVTLSTTPAYVDGKLVPRPMALRVFLARTKDGWQAMPGGFARIGGTEDASAIALQHGGSVADVWVVGDGARPQETMLSQDAATQGRVSFVTLPSRAADNLYWLGRYVERAEGVLRFLRAYHVRLAENEAPDDELLGLLNEFLNPLDIDLAEPLPKGLLGILAQANHSAGQVRDRFSLDGWAALNDLDRTAHRLYGSLYPGDDAARSVGALLRQLTGFSGLVHDNMYRFMGWRFLSIGRSLERAITTAAVLATFADPDAPNGALDLAVEIGDSTMSHRRRYSVETTRETVVDLLAFDTMNPRSIHYHLTEIMNHIGFLPGSNVNGQLSELARAILQTHTNVAVGRPETLDKAALEKLQEDISAVSDLLTSTYLR